MSQSRASNGGKKASQTKKAKRQAQKRSEASRKAARTRAAEKRKQALNEYVEDYIKALANKPDLRLVKSKINRLATMSAQTKNSADISKEARELRILADILERKAQAIEEASTKREQKEIIASLMG